MGQSLAKNYIHIIFATKYRRPIIPIGTALEAELHSYLAGICQRLDCQPLKVGGYDNHVHVFCVLSRKISLMNLVAELKGSSSKWIKTKDPALKDFYWQDGYGAFSVNPRGVERVKAYIANQHQHHRRQNLEDEYLRFLQEYQVDYDERYLWD